ncbi:hypothetical protein F5888DRAFT_1800663 [Russula emetica]|nr:hypothetical protein F5888DRAFT_1800663 [Russula emetica]
MSPRFIVVFKKDVPQDTIDRQADAVNQNGGLVNNKFDFILKGFSAEIPEGYLFTLQNSLGAADSPISYIGKADAIQGITCY